MLSNCIKYFKSTPADSPFPIPDSITIKVEKNTNVSVTGSSKQLVGQVAAKIREFKKPDSYKGKGVRYQGEVVKLKPGKAAKAAEA